MRRVLRAQVGYREKLVEAVLGVAEEHHAFRIVVQVIVHAGEAGTHAALENDDRLGGVVLSRSENLNRRSHTLLVVMLAPEDGVALRLPSFAQVAWFQADSQAANSVRKQVSN
jgi:hypothetical protein